MSILFRAKVIDASGDVSNIGQYIERGNITEAVGQPPTAKFDFLDKDKYIEHIIRYTDSFPILVEASTDSGAVYSTLFFGDVEDVNLSMDDKGDRHVSFVAYGGKPFRYNLLSPNQVGIGDCDIGAIFTGTPYAYYSTAGSQSNGLMWSVSWNSDSCGNYPNGLLYDTGFKLSPYSVVDLVGITDIPIHYGYGSTQILETIDSFLEPYGLTYIIYEYVDPPRFKILSNSALGSWETNSFHTLSVGKNVSTFDKRIDLTRKRNKMIVISGKDESIFDIYGNGSYEKLIQDGDINDVPTARSHGKLGMSLSAVTPEQWNISVLPISNLRYGIGTQYAEEEQILLGKSINFVDSDNTTLSKNVIEVSQQLGIDRWSTNIRLETPPTEIPKTLEEITAEFENLTRSNLIGQVYVRAKSITSSAYQYIIDNTTEDIYPCAIGIGTSSEISTLSLYNIASGTIAATNPDSYLLNPISIVPIRDTLSEGTPETTSAYTRFLAGEGIGLVREITLFGNTNSDGSPMKVSQLMSWNRPTNFVIENFVKATMTDLLSGTWPISVENITMVSNKSNCSVYQYKLSEATTKMITWSAAQTNATLSETWSTALSPPSQNKVILSQDTESAPYTTSVASYSATGSNYCQVEFSWKFPVSIPTLSVNYMDSLYFHLHGRGTWSNASTQTNEAVKVYIYTTGTNAWTFLGNMSTSGPSCSIFTYSYNTPDGVDPRNGAVRLLLMTSHSHADGTNSIVLNYGGVNIYAKSRANNIWYNTGSEELNYVIEKCFWDWKTGQFVTSMTPWSIGGIWLDGYLSSDNIFIPQETGEPHQRKGPRPQLFYQNLIEKYKMETAKANASNFTMYYNVVELDNPANNTGERKTYDNTFFINYDEATILIRNKYAWLSYSTKDTLELDSPQTLSSDIISIRYISASNGARSNAIIDCSRAPMYNNNIKVEYNSVGKINDWQAGIIARTVLSPVLDSQSILREGISKDSNKVLNLQFDALGMLYYGTIVTRSIPQTTSLPTDVVDEYNERQNIGYINSLGEWRYKRPGSQFELM